MGFRKMETVRRGGGREVGGGGEPSLGKQNGEVKARELGSRRRGRSLRICLSRPVTAVWKA